MRHSYVFVRTDQSWPQIAVQASHASIEAQRAFSKSGDIHPHLVLIGVGNELALLKVADYLDSKGIRYVTFFEPDNNSNTAIATESVCADARKVFRKYQLLKD